MLDSESEPTAAMPAQERLQETVDEDLPQNNGGISQEEEEESEDEDLDEPQLLNEDYDLYDSSDEDREHDEYMYIELPELRKSVQCPICLGIIRKARTVKECLHRFCRECVDKSMRMGNKECPACRKHCASRRSLTDDSKYDALVAVLFPNIDQYEEEELALNEEEDARKKQIQASISQTFERQSEAFSKKRKRSKSSTRRRSCHSDDNDAAHGNSSAEEHHETRPKRCRRSKGEQSAAAVGAGGGNDENNVQVNRDDVCALPSGGLVGSSQMLAWGRGGIRSHTRHPRNGRLAKLVEHLRHLDESHEMDIQILLVSLDVGKEPVLQQPYLSCKPTTSIHQICQFIAFQTSSRADEIEMLAGNELNSKISSLISSELQPPDSSILNECKDELQPLNSDQTLEEVISTFNLKRGHLILAYRRRPADPGASNEAIAGHQSS